MKPLEIILFLAGAIMLGVIVRHMDMATAVAAIGAVGAGFSLIFAQEIVAHIFNTLGWIWSFRPEMSAKIKFWDTVRMRIAGDGVNYLTPSATLAGEWAKAVMLGEDHPIEQRLASVAISKITQTLAMAFTSICGLAMAFWYGINFGELKGQIKNGGWLLLAIIAVIVILEVRASKSDKKEEKSEQSIWAKLKATDKEIMAFMKEYPGRFAASTIFFLAAYLWGAFEAFWICRFLGMPVSIPLAILIEMLSVFLDGIFFAVPGKAGTQEATKITIFTALGLAPATGFSFAIIRHLREILWALTGFGLYYIQNRFSAKKKAAGLQPSGSL